MDCSVSSPNAYLTGKTFLGPRPLVAQVLMLDLPGLVSLDHNVGAASLARAGLAVNHAPPEEAVPTGGELVGQREPLELPDLVHLVADGGERALKRAGDLLAPTVGTVGEPVGGVVRDQRHYLLDVVAVSSPFVLRHKRG